MKTEIIKNLEVPKGTIDAVLDTDTYNEVDDQFALAYMLRSNEKINIKAIYAAPFYNEKSSSPEDGMEKSYEEITRVLEYIGNSELKKIVYKGATRYLPDEKTAVNCDAVDNLIELARKYSSEKPLYVVAIATITNIASALIKAPDIADNIVIVWLGGHALHIGDSFEFNMYQDVAAARVVFNSEAPLIQIPCRGVVTHFAVSKPEFEFWLKGKNDLCDFLVGRVFDAQKNFDGKPWTRVIWDVTAVAWLLNENDRFMKSEIISAPIPEYDFKYAIGSGRKLIRYVTFINRDVLLEDLVNKLTGKEDKS